MRALVMLVALSACAPAVNAQPVPRVMLEVAYGQGAHSQRNGSAWFRTNKRGMLRVGGYVRAWPADSRFAPTLELGYSVPSMADKTDDCPLAPDGSCRVYFPKTDGAFLGVGAHGLALPGIMIGASIGVFGADRGQYVSLNAAWRMRRHLGLVADWRHIQVAHEGGKLAYRPVQLGLRLF